MKMELHDYDIYPKVFPAGQAVDITLRALGKNTWFGGEYKVVVQRLDSGSLHHPFTSGNHTDYITSTDENGHLHFTYTASAEGELAVRVYKRTNPDGDFDRRVVQMNLYALDADLADRLPLRGDLHIHTYRSDGHCDPAICVANYRRNGYDFIVVTDHGRYYPSLEAIRAYAGVDLALNILPGEEVHLPGTDVHIVNAGGLFSVNGLHKCKENYYETDGALDARRFDETITPPDIVTEEQYAAELAQIKEERLADCPANVDKDWFAVCEWAFDKIREADGLGIFAHPYWISDMWQMHEAFTRYMMEKHPFDAFEVLGGENYYQQNGFQTALYYDEYRHGRVHPIVGSTDSHNSTENNRNALICSTIVFAHENERRDILTSIKDRYSVAVDTISTESRLVGEHRFQKYAAYLMENFYPLHDKLAQADGELMRLYYTGDADAEVVNAAAAVSKKLFDKYFLLAR
ncbi:MAG: hypothetical protein IJ302_07665 [Clostridia bacterium]|nr:hypothetical protein [Clostridia bacterium]